MEAGVVVGFDGAPLYWHLPPNRTAGSIPDSRALWEVFWNNRHQVFGFAHSHPGSGMPGPSWEDITTFAGVEIALGRRLTWWIISSDQLVTILWTGPGKYDYSTFPLAIPGNHRPLWLDELRQNSNY